MEAQAIAEEKARELAVANSLVSEKTRQYAEVQRIISEAEQGAAALEDKFKMQMLETKSERSVQLSHLAFTVKHDDRWSSWQGVALASVAIVAQLIC